jgi:activator of 2-hydroxyglutaryl-CoA dehydratase
MQKDLFLGIDIGSVTIKTALLAADKALLSETYTRIKGDPLHSLKSELQSLTGQFPECNITAVGITGSGGKQIAGTLGAFFINEILAQSVFAGRYHPDARTIIEMGGEDAKLITLARDAVSHGVRIEDFAMNAACAAGTGSFLDQQASRLQLSIEEFSVIALKSRTPPRVAGRCSVFAKSDMIHLQQSATPDYDIVAGLCFAMARNFKATVGKGKKFLTPLLFLGGGCEPRHAQGLPRSTCPFGINIRTGLHQVRWGRAHGHGTIHSALSCGLSALAAVPRRKNRPLRRKAPCQAPWHHAESRL